MRDDWRAYLPEQKDRLNNNCAKELETLYFMLSVSLNEALELRRSGALMKAYEVAQTARGVCLRFTQSLELVLSGLHCHAKHFGVVPNAAPLDASNFRGGREQRTARITGFLNRVLLSQRSQFIHKSATLREMVGDLRTEFCEAVDDLINGHYVRSETIWEALDNGHFDLNTCLRETMVLLKSFLVVLPEDQLASFESQLKLPSVRTAPPNFAFRHRRFAAVPGK
ncbi:MAG TPA: hypothetical protein VN025_08000 [Candidatus Dormibacteraeota bacterium]|nr:hypothetical protein [Candidatus Dormibacteraeota bacterium]